MSKPNIIMISLDEVRPDHLSCYGYKKINTPAIDKIAKEGVLFEDCYNSSDFTPVAMGTVVTGKYPNKHGMRDPFCILNGPTVGAILKKHGYSPAGFVGNALLSEKNLFSVDFDYWSESTPEKSWCKVDYKVGNDVVFYEGNYWPDEFMQWIEDNYQKPFYMWGHLYETHESSEKYLVQRGMLKEGELSDFCYYDAKIKMADERIVARLMETLDRLGIADNTIVVIMSDHGTNLGEHEAGQIPWREKGKCYPQHTTMYDHDLKITMIMKGPGLPKGKRVKGMIRGIDLIPTLLELAGVPADEYDFDGESLMSVIEKGLSQGKELYAEDIFEPRGKGSIQAFRTDTFKYMRSLTDMSEEYYDLTKDPEEKNNIIGKIDKKVLLGIRKKLNDFLQTKAPQGEKFSESQVDIINNRLRGLGYIE